MKIEFKKVRLAAVSFICGVILSAALLNHSPVQRDPVPLATVGPILASTQVPPQSSLVFRIAAPQSTKPGVFRFESDMLLDQTPSLPGRWPAHNLDLIDMRYQPPVDLPQDP